MGRESLLRARQNFPRTKAGEERISTSVAALVDANVLVFRFDSRFPDKQKTATEIPSRDIAEDSVRVPHQAIMEFVPVVTRMVGKALPLAGFAR
jgi:hypothetical protein